MEILKVYNIYKCNFNFLEAGDLANNIGHLFFANQNYDEALYYFNEDLHLTKKFLVDNPWYL